MGNAEAENVRSLHAHVHADLDPDSVPSGAYPIISAQKILETDYPEPTWFIDELLPAGLTVFAGPPKAGKSWLALQFAVAVASGGTELGRTCHQAKVLYMSLEEGTGQGPMGKKRLEALAGDDGILEGLHFVDMEQEDVVVRPQLGSTLEASIKAYIAGGFKLIIIDTLGRVQSGFTPDYRAEVGELAGLANICRSTHDVGIVLITHTHKGHAPGSGDPFAAIYGTNAVAGTCQQMLLLERGDGNSRTLHRRSRHVGDGEPMALQALEGGSFTLLGAAAALQGGELSQQIVAAMVDAGASSSEPMTPADIKKLLAKVDSNTIDQRLGAMVKRGQVIKAGRGLYYPVALGSLDEA